MRGLMMEMPLLVSGIISHADAVHGDQEVATRSVEGPIVRATYSEVHRRCRQLANALDSLGQINDTTEMKDNLAQFALPDHT